MDSISPVWAPNTQLAGEYSLSFASGADHFGPWVNAFISQTGTIPSTAHSVQLLAAGPFAVFVGGVEVGMLPLGGNLYGGDVTGFAGTATELSEGITFLA